MCGLGRKLERERGGGLFGRGGERRGQEEQAGGRAFPKLPGAHLARPRSTSYTLPEGKEKLSFLLDLRSVEILLIPLSWGTARQQVIDPPPSPKGTSLETQTWTHAPEGGETSF